MKIAFSGYYGMRNFGDDLFCVLAIKGQRRYWNNASAFIVAPSISKEEGDYVIGSFLGKYYSKNNKFGSLLRLLVSLISCFKCTHFIYAGGSLFSNSSGGVASVIKKVLPRGKMSAIGVSIGPFKNSEHEKRVVEFLDGFSFVSVRDDESFERLKKYNISANITNAADIAGLIPLFYSFPKKERREVYKFGFSPCNILADEKASLEYCDHFYKIVSQEKETKGVEVVLFVLNENPLNSDLYLVKNMKAKLDNFGVKVTIKKYLDIGVNGVLEEINGLDVFFSVRLHGAISAYALGIPFYLYEYHEKCSQFNKLVNKKIMESDMAGLGVEAIFESLEEEKERLMPVEVFTKMAEKNFKRAPWCKK